MKFEWDEEKNIINKEKHKISFETAAYVFDDPYYIEMFDFEHSVDEDRYIAIGKVGDVLFVVFTERKETIRLIRNFLSLGITLLFHIHKGIIGCRQALDFLAFLYFL